MHGTDGFEELAKLAVALCVAPLLTQLILLQLACTCKITALFYMTQTCSIYWEHAVRKHLLQFSTPLAPLTKAST